MAINRTAAQVIVTSVSKAYSKASKTGKLNMSIITLYNLLAYYLEFTRGKAEYNQEHAFLIDKMNTLMYENDELCKYKSQAPTYITTPVSNTAPTISNNTVDLLGNDTYTFTVGELTLNYNDAENHGYKYLLVNPATSPNGTLRIGTTEVTSPTIIDIEGLSSVTELSLNFLRTDLAIFSGEDSFTFRVSDNPEDFLYSAVATMGIDASLASGDTNLPATIGDNTIYVDNRATTILTLAMFTSQLTPPYNDPEADLIDAIRIDEISTANTGIFYLNGTPIIEGDIITREDLEANLFTHEGPNQDSINSDVFNFSARDEGSQIWVQ